MVENPSSVSAKSTSPGDDKLATPWALGQSTVYFESGGSKSVPDWEHNPQVTNHTWHFSRQFSCYFTLHMTVVFSIIFFAQ